jgi:hypothetical protein
MSRLFAWILLPCLLLVACTAGTPSPSPSTGTTTPTAIPTTPQSSGAPSATGGATQSAPASSAPAGSFDPSRFVAVIDNPWFPLRPGMTWTYTGTKDGEPALDVVTVTNRTRVVDGVTCVVVQDRLKLNGRLEERTLDYYAQDDAGNVWYVGEDTAELDEHGNVTSREGTWHSGVDGASAGIFMEASPTVGRALTQEYYAGHAEDHFKVIDLAAPVTVPFGSFHDALLTEEWTPLEPDVLDHKYYVRDIGEIREVAVKGPTEELRLVSFSR